MRRIALALSFLTRLPCHPQNASEEEVGRSLSWFPLVGLLLGALLVAATRLLEGWVSGPVLAVSLATLLAAATGGLHLDGLADVFDALGAKGAGRERMLAILRDSRIGAHGAAALVLTLLAKTALLDDAVARGRIEVLLAFPVVARLGAVVEVMLFPYAREHGLGAAFRAHARRADLAVAGVTTLAVVAWGGVASVLAATATLALCVALARLLARRLGGLTGDAYGASIELAEVVFLLCVLAVS